MANRQKSFFDQDTKARPYWRQDRKANDIRRPAEPLPRFLPNMAPIAASSQSKSKLKAFRFEQKDAGSSAMTAEAEADKENAPDGPDTAGLQMIPPPQLLSQRSATKDLRECPQTPLGRLPLADLLATGEDTSRGHLNLTPIERVLWENSPRGSNPSNSLPAGKGRKRAHSSSPASSSQNETSNHFVNELKATDLQALQRALRTPKADPADDLWTRYSLNTDTVERRSPTALAGGGFSHLMHSSSPQTPASCLQKDIGGLRRSLSCIEWPTSVAKRRKLFHHTSQRTPAGKPIDTDDLSGNVERSKMSRVSLLVDKIHDGLVKPAARHSNYSSSEPSGSSPGAERDDSPSSPRKNDELPDQASQEAIDAVVTVLSQTAVVPRETVVRPLILSDEEIASLERADSSDFDDDDLDLEMMEDIDTHAQTNRPISIESMKLPCAVGDSGAGLGAVAIDAAAGLEEDNAHNSHGAAEKKDEDYSNLSFPSDISSSTVKVLPLKNDEFDDDETDIFAADLEDVCAKYDSQVQHQARKDRETADPAGAHTISDSYQGAKLTPKSATVAEVEVLSDDEDFGSDSDFEHIAAECAEATKTPQEPPPQSSHDRKPLAIQRYVIRAVVQSTYDDNNGRTQPEKVLSVQCERTRLSKVILLRQAWTESPCNPEAFIHLIGNFDRYGQCIVDNAQNLLILHPDHLISSTVVGDSFTCTRKAVLQDRVKATSDANQSTIYGHMLHEIFQEAMRANRWDDEFMATTIDNLATQYLETLFEVQIEHTMAVEQLKTRVVDLQAWAEIFVSAKPKPNAFVKDRNGTQSLMAVNKLLEVEEKVWSPTYGLKGNVDATVQVFLKDGDDEKTLTVPLELKTGKHQSAAHKAQTSLYTLLLSDRYDVEIASGILYYMQTSEISNVPTIRHELVPMIMQRNELATYVRHRVELPPMIKRPYVCGKCYAQTPCFIYHKMIDDGNGETSGMGAKFDDLVKHLNPNHQQFFSKWDDLLTKEEKDVVKFRRELWSMRSLERQKVGRCWGEVVIDPGSFLEVEGAPKINRFQYSFIKQKALPGFLFTESQITLGEPVVISDEKGHFALANGYVTRIRKHKVQVTIDRRLHNARVKGKNFDDQRNQSFVGIMVVEDGISQSTTTPNQPEEPMVYRIDKDEFSNGMAMVRNNLIRLMEKDVFNAQALRRLIVENVAPTFKPNASAYVLAGTASQADLNIDQKAAIEKVMSAKDYALVLGMPGTGKTTTIAHIIRALVAQGKSVLLTSYTHTAVDNILLKLRSEKFGIFRLGAVTKVHPEVQEFADLAGKPINSVEDLKRCYTQPIVATTCLGIKHPIFNQRIFDYCIVDEASQITLPVCLGPIRMARTFILVGDHYQLPPLVQNKEALAGGLDISLFKLLSDNHPASVTNLEHQYRMCEDIMTLSNTLIYDGRLKCGTPAVASRSISIPNMAALSLHHHNPKSILAADAKIICTNPSRSSCWLRDLFDPSTKACFVNTDRLIPQSREVLENGSRITNPIEATLATQLVESLLTVGLKPTDIGVITPYRSQLALIKQSLRHRSGVEMHTADKFQGRDKEVVILSLVHSNDSQIVGELLKDWRRINVALTRARTKLLILGSKGTLIGNDLLRDMIALMDRRGWCYDLPPGACEGHVWEEMATLSSGRGSAEVQAEKEPMSVDTGKLALGNGKENMLGRRMPAKQGKLNMQALLGKRPVLRDIVNDSA